ncbi:hypothetical protein N7I30_13835 [Aurantimonas litoralis]|nr:hypothetical protein [Aurantimonas litoralis]
MSATCDAQAPTRFDDQCCGVCARQAVGYGYAPKARWGQPALPVMWVCEDPDCLAIARETYGMSSEDFNRIESLAAQEGLEQGKAFAISIGTADLADMTDAQRCEFARQVVAGYRTALKVKLRDEAPF